MQLLYNSIPSKEFNTTPCVGRCSTVYGDAICRGCKRFMSEVSHWNQYNLHERASVWQRLDLLAQRIVPEFVQIHDQSQLLEYLVNNSIRYPAHLSVSSWALHCIENFQLDLAQLHKTGLHLTESSKHFTTIKELRLAIQKSLYTLSSAQKQRQEQEPQASR